MEFWATPHCGCTDDPRCFVNTAPTIVEVSPAYLDLNKGESGTITVRAVDAQQNLAPFPEEIVGPGYLPAKLVEDRYDDGAAGEATYRVEFPTEGEQLRSLVPVSVLDTCGQGDLKNVPVRLFYPPVITPIHEGSRWGDGSYLQMFLVDDPDFRGCNYDRWEVVEVTVTGQCGNFYYPPRLISCWCVHEECRTSGLAFKPEPDCCERKFTIEARDSSSPVGPQKGMLSVSVPNRPPRLGLGNRVLKVRPGETITARISADDPDGDTITITQTLGPGVFVPVQGQGWASSTWTWTVPDVCGESLRRVFVVGFNAADSYEAKSEASFVVRVRCPPKAYDAFALVPRGGSSTAAAYVYAPDSPSLSIKVGDVPFGLSVSAHVEDDPFAPGMGGFMVEFDVSAESTLCDGVYAVPFTVTDQDGLSSQATLYVHVVGNRPPQCSPEVLEGRTTVALSPTGEKRGMVFLGPY